MARISLPHRPLGLNGSALSEINGDSLTIPLQAFSAEGFDCWTGSARLPAQLRVSRLPEGLRVSGWEHAGPVLVPASAAGLDGFTDWAESASFPRQGRICYLGQEVFLDMSPDELEGHNPVKTEVLRVVGNLNIEIDLGKIFSDGALLRNRKAKLSTVPDGLLATWESFRTQRMSQVPQRSRQDQSTLLDGAPDWLLEVVSHSSVRKDTVLLPPRYFVAGVREYWLIDARGEEIEFRILIRGQKSFKAGRVRSDWHFSPLFGRWFRLSRRRHPLGPWVYRLEMK